MKRLLLVIISVFLSACTIKNVEIEKPNSIVQNTSSENNMAKIIFIANTVDDIDFANKMKIKDIIISSKGVRIDDKNYRTDYKNLKNLDALVLKAKSSGMNFYIEITSGPGYDLGKNNFGIFKRDSQKYYFAQMMNEIAKRYKNVSGFKGLSIKLETKDAKSYINTISYIYKKINGVDLIYNLYISDLNLNSTMVNKNYINSINLNFNSLNYPGYSILSDSNFEINRNILLSNLQKLKGNNQKIVVRVSASWSDGHDVFLQDLFEISRILNFDIVLDNTNALQKSQKLLKIIKRVPAS